MQIYKFCKLWKESFFILNKYKSIHNYIFNMNKAYMRCPAGAEAFDISFQYVNINLKVNRQFNFNRKLSEPVSAFLTRISANLEKVVNKKQKKKKNDDTNNERNLDIKLYQNGQEVSDHMLCEELFQIAGDIRLTILDQEYHIIINAPWIKNLELPTSMLANFPIYPAKFETLFVNKNLSEFHWYKSEDKTNWKLVESKFLFYPNKDDIGSYVKLTCLPKNESLIGPSTEVISTEKIQANPGICPFENRHAFTANKLSGKNFRIVTYNLLADLYCDSDYSRSVLFPYCPPYALNIDYRKQLILKELIGYNGDIICLQEVDEKIFENDLTPVLLEYNLEGIFYKKGGTLREGLAMFYNKSRFNVLESNWIILGENLDSNPIFSDLWNKIKLNENLVKRLTDRGTILQIVALESVENNEIIIVANTHLYFHPDADHIRLLQAGIASMHVETFIKDVTLKYENKRTSLIFCGDFNSVPECGIYKLFTTGHVPVDYVDWSSNVEEAVKDVSLHKNSLLSSACGTPKYTNYTLEFKDCLDYIFYEKQNFEVTQVIPLYSDEELSLHTAIPSVVIPSDHISLIADLKLL